jgi:hypothetical protein
MSQPDGKELVPYGDNFIPILRFGALSDPHDGIIHTAERPFCNDRNCPCHTGEDAKELNRLFFEGLVSLEEAARIMEGRQDFR